MNCLTNIIAYEKHDEGYGEICLNRPEKNNAVSQEMTKELMTILEDTKQDSLKFLVVTGNGNMFCAGGDLLDLHGDLTTDEAFSLLYPMKEVLFELANFPVPTIAMLNGNALGGGCELATACDVRIAKEATTFGFVQTKLGILPGWGGGALLYEKVNPSFAMNWLMEASILKADQLMQQGWLQKIVPMEDWEGNFNDILKSYISKSYEQMRMMKLQYKKKISSLSLSSFMSEEVRNCASLWETPEHRAAVSKFINRNAD
ncbi:enoyl-CoA hydratase/isomerase family protein [Virgibacillus oceani]